MLTEKELAERGALIRLQELKTEAEGLYESYPGLLQRERMAKREQTMLERYGTLNPHEAQQKAAKAEKDAKAKAKTGGPKKSHHKKKAPATVPVTEAAPGAESADVGEAVAAAVAAQGTQGTTADVAQGEPDPVEELIEVTEEVEPAGQV